MQKGESLECSPRQGTQGVGSVGNCVCVYVGVGVCVGVCKREHVWCRKMDIVSWLDTYEGVHIQFTSEFFDYVCMFATLLSTPEGRHRPRSAACCCSRLGGWEFVRNSHVHFVMCQQQHDTSP